MRKRIIVTIGLVLCLMLLGGCGVLGASETFEYEDNGDGTATITRHIPGRSGTSVSIPAEINGLVVTAIGDRAFHNNERLTVITIPETITTLPWTLGFISSTVRTTGESELFNNLTRIEVSEQNPVFSSIDGVLYNNDATVLIRVPPRLELAGFAIPDTVTTIARGAFWGCKYITGNLVIPENVTAIERSAFERASGFTGDLFIPDSVTYIGYSAFHSATGFDGNLTLPSGITTVADYAFYGLTEITGDLIIPYGVTTIGEYAFSNSAFTGRLILPESLVAIERGAFASSRFVGSLVIPRSVTTVGERAFSGVAGFTGDLVIPGNVVEIGAWAFSGGLDGSNSEFTGLTISYGVSTIGESAFSNVNFVGHLVIPDSVTEIGSRAFDWNRGFTGLTLSANITRIEERAFAIGSEATGSLVIPYGVTTIGRDAFVGTGFSDVVIPESVTEISGYAFAWCNYLTSVTIPESVTVIAGGAFYGNSRLSRVVFLGDAPESYNDFWSYGRHPGDGAFIYMFSRTASMLPQDSEATYLFERSTKLEIFYDPERVGWDEAKQSAFGYDMISFRPLSDFHGSMGSSN